MKITQIRNATLIIEYKGHFIIVDPMLAKKASFPRFRLLNSKGRNPLVELPHSFEVLKDKIGYALITHCQKGHIDHLDNAGTNFLSQKLIPTFCNEKDDKFLSKRNLQTIPLKMEQENSFFDGTIEMVNAVHATGFMAHLMEHGVGYFIKLPGEKSLYIMGDTILTEEIRRFIKTKQPNIIVAPTGNARFDIGSEILLSENDIIELGQISQGTVIANHMDALDHCRISRENLFVILKRNRLEKKFLVPADGETIEIN